MRRLPLAFAFALAVALGPGLSALAANQSVQTSDNVFMPGKVTVNVGETVTWHYARKLQRVCAEPISKTS